MRCRNTSIKKKKFDLVRVLDFVAGGGIVAAMLLGLILTLPATHAEQSSSDSLQITLATSCTLTGTINTPHTATVAPGINTEGIGTTTIKAICNDVNGFSLYAIGYTDDTEGKTVLTSNLGTSYDIPTGTATSGTSNWSMKVNSVAGTTTPSIYDSFDSYHSVPSSYTKVAGYNGTTDPTNGSSVTTTYALYTSPSQMTGTYTGQVKYVMVHPSTSNGYTVTFNPNGGTVSPTSEVVPLGSSVILPTPTQEGYKFLGWYTAPTEGTKIGDAGDSYTPTDNIVMHAQWQEQSDLFGITNMQEMTSEICKNTTTPSANATQLDTDGSHSGDTNYVPSKTLTDTRGGSYVVRKYADGNCWMAQNLNLSLSTSTTLTNADTDLNSKASWTPGTATSVYPTVPANSTDPTSLSRGDKYCRGTASGGNQTCDNTPTGDMTNHVGILYNWYAATAMSGTAGMASQDSTETTDAEDSICPKGWQLPTGGTSNKTNRNNLEYSFNNLLTTTYSVESSAAGSVKMRSTPLSFILSGYYNSGSLVREGSFGFYWSSSAYTSSSSAYDMYFNTSYVYPQDYNNKYYGFSVRCVAR